MELSFCTLFVQKLNQAQLPHIICSLNLKFIYYALCVSELLLQVANLIRIYLLNSFVRPELIEGALNGIHNYLSN